MAEGKKPEEKDSEEEEEKVISKETMSIAFKKGIKKKIKEIYSKQMK